MKEKRKSKIKNVENEEIRVKNEEENVENEEENVENETYPNNN